MTITEDLREFRTEHREGMVTHLAADEKAHDEILSQLRVMNGTQRDHGLRLVKMEVQQGHQCRGLASARENIDSLFAKIRKIDISRARQAGYIAGVVMVVLGLFQYVIMPVVQHVFSGG